MAKAQSTTPAPGPDGMKTWMAQLMSLTGTFSDEAAAAIDADITEQDLARTYSSLNSATAPGPTGIGYSMWTKAPRPLVLLSLRLFNEILSSGTLPLDYCKGTVYPVPKDANLPTRGQTAAPSA